MRAQTRNPAILGILLLVSVGWACGGENPLDATSLEGVYSLEKVEFKTADGDIQILLAPDVSGEISFEKNGAYVWSVSLGEDGGSGSGTYSLSGGVITLDGTATFSLATTVSDVNLIARYTGDQCIMTSSFDPPHDDFLEALVFHFKAG